MTRTQAKLGLVAGQPRRYIHGHCGPNREEARERLAAGVKLCGGCKREKPLEAFGKHPTRADGLQVQCRACSNERSREHHLKRKYGLTLAAREALFVKQDGICPGCGKNLVPFGKGQTVVDHCHDTGVVRGLLCSLCNTAIGHAGDDPARLRRLADYVEGKTPQP